ncbi:RNA-directed DNA polymerase [Escherichia coli]|uniref:RNA-directed DNA polymerase n=1 Tax=Escherichia coli TaxID=562 RepID=A0A376LAT9_ECOLX|nr:RNA-directed DNA polymerase [Escherichia coli]
MGRWFAGRLMKELGLVSCQQPTHRYKRGGHEHVAIPKSNSKQRPLGSPALRDCIVQRAMLMAMGAEESDFHTLSYGFRLVRNVHYAIRTVKLQLTDFRGNSGPLGNLT